ncbi:MAG: nitrous oxide reductase family maturation protein NosD [Bacteroidota bacterium]
MRFFSFFCCLLSILMPPCLNAAVVKVGSQQTFKTVHEGIFAAHDGDTVLVYPGLYLERNIVVNKAILLKGINYPVLDGERTYEILSIRRSNVTVEGFKVQRCGHSDMDDLAGIKIYDARNVIIRNNILDDTFFGIYTQFGTNCTIENNKITAYGSGESDIGNGIHCWKSDSITITNNTISGHRDGIYFEFVTHSVIRGNTSEKNMRYGLHFMFSHNDDYISNTFRSNGAGVAVMYTRGIKMINNLFENNWGDAAYGLLLKEISDSYLSGNRFINNTMGIFMESSNRISMEKNLFKNNGWAVKIQSSCDGNTISHSNFIGNTFDIATSGSLVMNKFDYNYWDRYEGYDLNKNKIGDVPYRPVSVYSMIVEGNPAAMMLFRSFIVTLMDKTEKVLPSIIPENLKDDFPLMVPVKL